jgi:putative DNA-invertase from lambdoid prophage Rac
VRTVAYVRVSTDKQELENQRFEIERYALAHSLVVDNWDEEIVSGTVKVTDRKIGSLLEGLESGDTIIVSEISRLSRSLVTVLTVIQDCVERGVVIITVKENFTFGDNLQSKVFATMFGLVAEIERSLISARTKEALARLKSEGVRLGRPPGTGRPEKLKLYGRDEKILNLMDKRVSFAAMARLLGVNKKTLRNYLDRQDLRTKHRYRQFEKTDV